MIFLVIVLHVALSYVVPFSPGFVHDPDPKPIYLWYIIGIIDGPMLMATLFFLAGYFTFGSLAKKGAVQFVKDKLVRIGIPWVLGGVILTWFQGIFAYYANGGFGTPIVSLATFFGWLESSLRLFRPQYYSQHHFWFLGVLLWFFLAIVLMIKIFKKRINPAETKPGKPSWLFLILFGFITTAASFAVSLAGPFSTWTRIYVIEFQNMFLPVYIAYFLLGIHASRWNWFKDGYRPKILPWTLLYIITMWAHISFYIIHNYGNPLLTVPKLICAATYNGVILSWLFMLLALFQKFFNSGNSFWQSISRHSYTAYIFHLIVIFTVVLAFRSLPINYRMKFILAIVVVTVISWGIGFMVKGWPGVKAVLYAGGRKDKAV
jgi:hypothetical protein